MKVLIVSHNAFSHTVNMGKTLLSYFTDFSAKETAQFYIHSEVPTIDTICTTYYRFTDKDALKSLVSFKVQGVEFQKKDIEIGRKHNRTDTGLIASLYETGSRRTSLIYLLRSALWFFAHWNTRKLRHWLDEQKPDVVFFASSDYIFMYDVAAFIADYCDAPLVIACVDDYYINNSNGEDFLGKVHHLLYKRTVWKTAQRAKCLFAICDTMNTEYGNIFKRKCYTLHTSVSPKKLPYYEKPFRISYIGNLDFLRYKQLIDIAAALFKITHGSCELDVYSGETKPEVIGQLKETKGLHFHGRISADDVLKVMSESVLVIHTECFDENTVKQVRYSVSTKIAESLMYGPCLLAYGPQGIASIDYLEKHKAAYVITSKELLEDGLREILGNSKLRSEILANARALAQTNHRTEVNSANVRKWLEEAIASKE